MHNALTDYYFVVSLVYSASLKLWEGVGEGLTKHRMHTCPFGAPYGRGPLDCSPTCPMDNPALHVI